jgi:hypothetical protein
MGGLRALLNQAVADGEHIFVEKYLVLNEDFAHADLRRSEGRL